MRVIFECFRCRVDHRLIVSRHGLRFKKAFNIYYIIWYNIESRITKFRQTYTRAITLARLRDSGFCGPPKVLSPKLSLTDP